MRGARAFASRRAGIATALPMVLLVAFAVAGGVAATNLASRPMLVALALAAAAGVAAVLALLRRAGAVTTWVVVALVAVMAGEMSSLAVGGQSGKLLWADFVIGIGAAVAVARHRFAVEIPRQPWLDRLWPLIAWSALALMVAEDPLTSVAEIKEWLAAAVLAIGAAAAATNERRARVLLAAVAGTGVLVAVGMIGVALVSPLGAPIAIMKKLVDLPWGRTNYLAGLLILGIPLLLGLMGDAASVRARALCAAGLVLSMAGLAVSASKGAILSLAVALALTFGLARRQARAPRLIVLVVFGAAAAVYLAGPLKQVMEMRLASAALDYSASERFDLYRLAWEQFLRHPIFGVGLNVFSVVSHRFHGLDTVPHNFELGFAAELGLPGVLMAIAWAWALGAGARQALRSARTPRERSLGLGLTAAFLAFALHNQVESTLYGQQYKMLLFVYAAAAWAIGREWSRRATTEG